LLDRAPAVVFVFGVWPQPLEALDIGKVLKAARGSLIDDEVLTGQDEHSDPVQIDHEPRRPSTLELDGIDRRENVDTDWRYADLKDDPGSRKVRFREVVERCTEFAKGRDDSWRVVTAGSHPYIEILGGPNVTMHGERVSAHDQVFNAVRVECG